MGYQLWTLFARPRNSTKGSKWTRIGNEAGRKEVMIRWYQNLLICNALGELESDKEYRLRPITNREPAQVQF